MNWVDILMGLTVGIGVWYYWERGVVENLVEAIAWLIGIMLGGLILEEWIRAGSWAVGVSRWWVELGLFFGTATIVTFVGRSLFLPRASGIKYQNLSVGWQRWAGGLSALILMVVMMMFWLVILEIIGENLVNLTPLKNSYILSIFERERVLNWL